MSNHDLANSLTNALGGEYFNPDTVIEALAKQAAEMQAAGQHPGSLWAVANILPEITEEARKRYGRATVPGK